MSVKNYIHSQIKDITDAKTVYDGYNLRDDLDMDSLDQLDLVVRIQKEYKLQTLDEKTLNHIYTVGDLVGIVETIVHRESNKVNAPVLYTIKNGVPYCRVTEKPCQKLRDAAHIVNPTNCCATKCKIVKNVQNIFTEYQKTK